MAAMQREVLVGRPVSVATDQQKYAMVSHPPSGRRVFWSRERGENGVGWAGGWFRPRRERGQ